jgi:hypothetical protein
MSPSLATIQIKLLFMCDEALQEDLQSLNNYFWCGQKDGEVAWHNDGECKKMKYRALRMSNS